MSVNGAYLVRRGDKWLMVRSTPKTFAARNIRMKTERAGSVLDNPKAYQYFGKSGDWLKKHGKTLLVGTAVVGGIVVAGAVVYTLVEGILQIGNPSQGSPACQALLNALGQVNAQIGVIYALSTKQGGTFTSGQTSALKTLYNDRASIIGQIKDPSICPISPAASIDEAVQNLLYYGTIIGLVLAGVVASAWAVSYVSRVVASSRTKGPGELPESPEDVVPGTGSTEAVGSQAAGAQMATDAQSGTMTVDDVNAIVDTMQATDPAYSASASVAAEYTAASDAAATSGDSTLAAIFDTLSAIWEAIYDVLYMVYAEIIAFITAALG